MKGRIIADWKKAKAELNTAAGRQKFMGAFQFFMGAMDRVPELKSAYQAFTTSGDFPPAILAILKKYHALDDFDLGYEQFFDIRDYTGTQESGFEILDVLSGLAFKKIKPGMKADVYKMSGDKVSVNFDLYGGGLNWEKTWMADNKFWNMEDTSIEFRNKFYASRALAFYALIEALPSATDVAWQVPENVSLPATDPNYYAARDIATIQLACNNILESLKDTGIGVTANTVFKLLAPNVLRSRINRALKLLTQPVSGADTQNVFNVQPVYTLMLKKNQTDYYVAVPGKKMKGGYRMDLTLLAETNILAFTDTIAGWGRHGGGIGETRQLRRCKTS